MTVDSAHAVIWNTLCGTEVGAPGLHDVRLADPNETEREHASRGLGALLFAEVVA